MPDPAALAMARQGPTLSATSDMPAPAAQPTPADDSQKAAAVDETAAGADKSTTAAENDAGESAAGSKEKGEGTDVPAWQKARITAEANKRRAAEERAKALETENARLRELSLKALEQVTAKPEPKEDPRPSRDTFDDPDAYDKALEAWAGRQAAAKAVADDRKARETEQQRARAQETVDTYNARRAEFVKANPDFEEIVEADDLHFTPAMTVAIVHDEDGPAVAYYLAKNPEEFDRISKMDTAQAAVAIGRIAARLNKQPVDPKPDPIKPLNGSRASAAGKSAEEMSMAEYAAKREADRLAAWKAKTGRTN
ncbi:MAG TPA: hypothetical protein VMU59_07445 [Caulobacteraceae bacterium]|nr:hypothetical protein [Caulobacteraceae bacterium]